MKRANVLAALVAGGLAGLSGAAFAADGELAKQWSWGVPQAKVLPTGGLEWAPRPFEFKPGPSVRYIDFEKGNDANSGESKDQPWKHHPWDAAATGKAKDASGAHTYVFKRGVAYRGALKADESGAKDNPIQLTSDPSWGEGEARIYGSYPITGGWKPCAATDAREGMPEPEKLWYIDLPQELTRRPFRASAMWMVQGERVERMNIARDPNWTITDPNVPMSNWHQWETSQGQNNKAKLADTKNLKGKPADFYKGGEVWTQHPFLMGSVHRTKIGAYDPEAGTFEISSPGGANYGNSPNAPAKPRGVTHYYIENVAGVLDAPGEYFYATEGQHRGRLYLRPPEGVDPNSVTFEVARVKSPVQIIDQSNISVSGLQFSFNDDYDGKYGFPWHVGNGAMVRVIGNCTDITVKNCSFQHVMCAVVAFPRAEERWDTMPDHKDTIGVFADDVMDGIYITDNDVQHVDQIGAIWCNGNSKAGRSGTLKRVEVMRNRVVNSGFRPGYSPTTSIPAISVVLPETAEIAGNIVDTSWGNGIFTLGGKSSGSTADAPLSRILIHHNQVENTMLGCNDYGALEMFQGGPAYFYNNVARNTVGTKTFNNVELGYTLYLDGGFKIYSFNNILDGRKDEGDPKYYNHCGYFMVFGFMDHLFNNTIHRFEYGFNGSSGNRSAILGNVVEDASKGFMVQNRPGDASMVFGGDTGEMGRVGIATMVYDKNVFWGKPAGGRDGEGAFGMVGGTSGGGAAGQNAGRAVVHSGKTIEELRAALEKERARGSNIGVHVDQRPLAAAPQRDFRLSESSAAIDSGVKFFVPWGLAAMVGEWNFYKSPHAPQVVLGENFYMQEELADRAMYYFVPRNDLTLSQAAAEDYVAGALEDWTAGALRFDGKRFATLTHAEMSKDMEYPGGRGGEKRAFKGADRKTLDMGVNNFLIEAYFKTAPGHTGGAIAEKGTDTGYRLGVNAAGQAELVLSFQGRSGGTASQRAINDGQWHHVIAEVDRESGMTNIYIDGRIDRSSNFNAGSDISLANAGDFIVGKSLVGELDFLRVSRGTLADAKTNIGELYAWQFDGPHLRDFAGKAPMGERRDAGALERK